MGIWKSEKNTASQYKLTLFSYSTVQYHKVMDVNFIFMFPRKDAHKI